MWVTGVQTCALPIYRESKIHKIISETNKCIQNISGPNRQQQYKDILREGFNNLLQNIDIDCSTKDDTELFFNTRISNNKISEFIRENLKSIEKLPIIDTSNLTMGAIHTFAKSMLESTSASPIMRGAIAGIFGANFLIGIAVIVIVIWRNKKGLESKNLKIMCNFWGRFCKQLKTLLEEPQSSLMKLICVCPTEEVYAKLEKAKNIIDTLH